MDIEGLDALIAKFDRMYDEIEDDVGEIVKNNTIDMTKQTIKNERRRFNKGYATGFTMRHTKTKKVDSMHYRTDVASEHGSYLNYGTRYMDATWFLRDAYFNQRQKFLKDLERLVK